MHIKNYKIGIIGLGYVGLPLAIEFAKKYAVIGFDIDSNRISELLQYRDITNESNIDDLRSVTTISPGINGLCLTATGEDLKTCNIYIVTVPTPVDENKAPDLTQLLSASALIGNLLDPEDIVIYESTVYPGCTEEDCVPVLEEYSGLKFNEDFFCGYSPERINPGDKIHTLTKIKKVTSGSTPETARRVNALYASIIVAGTHLAPSIKVAEASKAIENAQRDVNISFVNELALIFSKMEIDTTDVLEAAATKWNFLNYKPGLVGGHCIGVDPYYLAFKSEAMGYKPEVILSGRRVNSNMGKFVAEQVMMLMEARGKVIPKAEVLILGLTFKENCPDTRNTQVIDIVKMLQKSGVNVSVFDPHADGTYVKATFGIILIDAINRFDYDAVILTVAHKENLSLDFQRFKDSGALIYDTKSVIPRKHSDGRL